MSMNDAIALAAMNLPVAFILIGLLAEARELERRNGNNGKR